jgi:hypothetical protein
VSAGTEGTDQTPRSATFRLVLLVVLVVVLLAAGGVLVWLLTERRGQADDVQADRDAVLSETQQFVLRLNTYGPDDLDDTGALTGYRQRVTAVITPKFAADFESEGLPIAEQTVKQAGYARSAQVEGVGLESVDGGSATAIVAATLTGSYPDPKHPQDETRRREAPESVLRWEVDLVRTGGTWLVDDYAPVTGEGDR